MEFNETYTLVKRSTKVAYFCQKTSNFKENPFGLQIGTVNLS